MPALLATSDSSPGSATAAAPIEPMRASSAQPCRVVDSTELLQGQRAIEILHNGLLYRLQATRLGKLILTK